MSLSVYAMLLLFGHEGAEGRGSVALLTLTLGTVWR